ncbi:hypothetical protein [Nocardia callitridis]|uniref:Uncharacterized protein n=1 Tax=Nocardia callitridis TaxID=648753 RepID=A0ABP9KG24_9NOCA
MSETGDGAGSSGDHPAPRASMRRSFSREEVAEALAEQRAEEAERRRLVFGDRDVFFVPDNDTDV